MKTLRAWPGPALLLAAILVFTTTRSNAATASDASTTASIPADWIKVDTGPFSFMASPDIRAIPVQGVDSFIGRYTAGELRIHFDRGRGSSRGPAPSRPNPPGEKTVIHGKTAWIEKTVDRMEVRFPELDRRVSAAGNETIISLNFDFEYKSESAAAAAETIIRSLRIVPEGERYTPATVPGPNWKQVVAGDFVAFAAPPDLQPDDRPLTGDFVIRYSAPGLAVSVGRAKFSGPPVQFLGTEAQEFPLTLNSIRARCAATPKAMLICFAEPSAAEYNGPVVMLEYDNFARQEDAIRIMRTLAPHNKEVIYKSEPRLPDGWTRVRIANRFEFDAPPGSTQFPTPDQRFVSGGHQSGQISIRFSFENASDAANEFDDPALRIETATIDGKTVKIAKEEDTTKAFYAGNPPAPDGKPQDLFLYVTYRTPSQAKDADAIIRSVRFVLPN